MLWMAQARHLQYRSRQSTFFTTLFNQNFSHLEFAATLHCRLSGLFAYPRSLLRFYRARLDLDR